MSEYTVFKLKNEAINQELGTVTFNGKFVFELSDAISPQQWRVIGFIPLKGDQTKTESKDLFSYLNSRLPIDLRDKSTKRKLDYISHQGLKVASDSFVLIPENK